MDDKTKYKEIPSIEELEARELGGASGGRAGAKAGTKAVKRAGDIRPWEIYGVTCNMCGHFGLWEYDCSCVGRTWTVVYKCPSCGGFTFKTLTVPDPT